MLTDKFFKKGSDFLGVKYPLICGAMTWVSTPELVASVCNAGGFASLAGGNMPGNELVKQIEATRKLTTKPFAVNLITIAPAYQEQLKVIEELHLPFVVFAGSFPREKEIVAAKNAGAKVLCFASTRSIASRMIKYGTDALILEGMEAGGHVGKVSLSVLIQQVLFEVDEVPLFVAGGIGTGKFCAHLLLMGASGIQLGTRFAVSTESCAHKDFKEAFVKADARDAVSTPAFDSRLPVVAVRALRNKGLDNFGKLQLQLIEKINNNKISRADAQIEVEAFWSGALRRAVVDGDITAGSLMAGQSVGLVNKIQSVEEIINELVRETEKELQLVKDCLHRLD